MENKNELKKPLQQTLSGEVQYAKSILSHLIESQKVSFNLLLENLKNR
jgi:hypothetical protein